MLGIDNTSYAWYRGYGDNAVQQEEKGIETEEFYSEAELREINEQIIKTARACFQQLRDLPAPWAAAYALSNIMVLLTEAVFAELKSDKEVRKYLKMVVDEAMQTWRKREQRRNSNDQLH